jgi:hypothetical protein
VNDKYQVLAGEKVSVIENEGLKNNRWRVIVPDAGSLNTAIKLARLLNEEHIKFLKHNERGESNE